jgi:hypothetical protein
MMHPFIFALGVGCKAHKLKRCRTKRTLQAKSPAGWNPRVMARGVLE